MSARTPGHALRVNNPLFPVGQQRYYCECGKWDGAVPDRGPFNSTSIKARIGVVITAHGRHLKSVRAAIAKAVPA